jgi:hypothetical protein
MGVFDSLTQCKRAVADPVTDHKLPHPKSLSWAGITTPTAVLGTTGAHCDLLHGDQWTEIKGDHKMNIAANQTIKVVGKHKETIVESCYQNMIGPHIVTNCNARNETRLGTYTEVYGDQEIQRGGEDEWEKKWHKYEVEGFHFEAKAIHVESTAALLTVAVANVTMAAINATMTILKDESEQLHLSHWTFSDVSEFLGNRIAAAIVDMGAGEMDYRCIMNACPEIHIP